MQPPVSDEIYREFLKTFQSFRDPTGLTVSSLLDSPLVRAQRQPQSNLLPHQALQASFTAVLTMVAAENRDYADLLHGRFWEGKQIEEMLTAERPLPMSKRTFSNYQRNAIQTFAFLFLQAETNLPSQQAAAFILTQPEATPSVATAADPSATVNPPVDEPVDLRQTTAIVAGVSALPTHTPLMVDLQADHGAAIPLPTAPQRRPIWLLGGLLFVATLLLVTRLSLISDHLVGGWLAAPAELLFIDDFENGADKWNADSADWAIQVDESGNHFYCVKTAGPAYTYAQAGNTTWQDYTLQLDLKLVQTAAGGSGNILWRVADGFYPFYLMDFFAEEDGNGFALEREDGDLLVTLDQSLNRLPPQLWLPLRMEVKGNQMQLFVGTEALPTLQATDPQPISQGGIGLGAGFSQPSNGRHWEVCFDNIQITKK